MTKVVRVLRNRYADSVKLMRISEQLAAVEGVESASAVMATPMNLDLLIDDGYPRLEADVDDLVLAVSLANDQNAEDIVEVFEHLLAERSEAHSDTSLTHSQRATIDRFPEINIALIAVPGAYAALEAWQAVRAGREVFIFSDNVPLEQEVSLKQAAAERGLLVMGPDCGTSIIGGVGLGFANRVRRGTIGLVGASGTGLQQVSSLIHQAGGGIAAAIGTGSRDLSAEVGGIMTKQGITLLASQEDVDRIGLISKPSHPGVTAEVMRHLEQCGKPAFACLLGYETLDTRIPTCSTLSQLATVLMDPASAPDTTRDDALPKPTQHPASLAALYCGGTLCSEAERIAMKRGFQVGTFVDVGDDMYTRGRAHPMIDPRLRTTMIGQAGDAADVLLFDIVLGDLAHPDPVGATLPGLDEAYRRARNRGVDLRAFACLIGTDLDPQGLSGQRVKLEGAGVRVFASNDQAARQAILTAQGLDS